jgi:hypothetical protein
MKERRKKRERSQVPMIYIHNPSYSGGRDREDPHSKPALGKKFRRHCLRGKKTSKREKRGLVEWLKQ